MGGPVAGLARLERAAESGELDVLCSRHGVRVLTVFGSTARGEASPRDLDIGVLFEHGTQPEAGAVDRELAARLQPSAGMRTILVHTYLEVDHEIVAAAVPQAVVDYREYVGAVATWIRDPQGGESAERES